MICLWHYHYHSITEFVLLMNILGKRSDLPFSRKSDRKKEKCTVSSTHEQNIICSQTQLDRIAHEQTIICRQLFAGHVEGSRPMKRKKNLLLMIITIMWCIGSSSTIPSRIGIWKTEVPGEKPLRARERTYKKLTQPREQI